jgi:addiction module HigA family antidote
MTRMYKPPHPGEVLREYLGDLTICAAAVRLGIDSQQLEQIIAGADAVSPALASHLGAAFGTSSELWMGMQAQYDSGMGG